MKYLLFLFLAACSIPDADDLHEAAQCLRDANVRAQVCIDVADVHYETTLDVRTYKEEAAACAFTLIDDIAACTDAAGDALE